MSNSEIREILMNAVVALVANGGMEEASSRSIGDYAKVNSAYIYRYFIDKEDLISRTFKREMQGFYYQLESLLRTDDMSKCSIDEFALNMWNFVFKYAISNLEKSAFVYYFCNSPSFSNSDTIAEVSNQFRELISTSTQHKIVDEINIHICNNLILFAAMKIFQNGINDEQELQRISNKCFELFLQAFKKSIG